LDEKRLFEYLLELGLPKREADIYIFLSRGGPQKAQSVAAHLKIDRAQTYRSLMSLQQKGIVQQALEAPTRFIAVPIESLLEAHIRDKKSEVARMEAEKSELIDYFKTIGAREKAFPMAKFQVITGKSGIYSRISQMVSQSKKEILSLTTSVGLIQEDVAGILDAVVKSAREKGDVQFRMLANISRENLQIVKGIVKKTVAGKTSAQWRHIDLGTTFYPRFVIKDEEEAILCVISQDKHSTSLREDTGLWINSRMFVSTLKTSFMEMWRSAVSVEDRINELETGKPREVTLVLKEPTDAQSRIQEALDTARKEVILISSSAGINKIVDDDMFKGCARRGVKIRIMAPIDLENIESARRLSKLYEIKHVSISYLTMMIADSMHLFIFKAPFLEEESFESPFQLHDTFYTNDRKFVERAAELMKDVWKRGTLVSEVDSGGPMGTPIVEVAGSMTVLKVIEVMLKKGVSSVLVSSENRVTGIIDQRDILEDVVKGRNKLDETTAAEIMSTPILTVDSDTPLIDALRTLKEKRIPRLAVMKKGKLIAMLT